MTKAKSKIPPHLHTVTPCLLISDGFKAIEFYKKAFGAEELMAMPGPDGQLMHAEIKIGNSVIFLGGECVERGKMGPLSRGGATSGLMIYLDDVDSAWDKAVQAGCKVDMPLADQFWGDRFGSLTDPFGHVWNLASHIEDLTDSEIKERQEAFCKQMAAAAK